MPSLSKASGVTHILSDTEGWLSQIYGEQFPMLPQLLELGAVWHNKTRLREDAWISKGDYVRIHPRPIRYSAVLKSEIIRFCGPDFVVVEKPAGLPVHATIDNAIENIVALLTPKLGPVFVTQRLDTGTTGLFILGRTREFQVFFNKLLIKRRVFKRYVALSDSPPPLGLWTHYASPSFSQPKIFSTDPSAGTQESQTRALSVSPWRNRFEVLLEPLTGRTHQLRAQMMAHGTPILGDSLYGGCATEGYGPQNLALHCTALGFDSHLGSWSWHSTPRWRT